MTNKKDDHLALPLHKLVPQTLDNIWPLIDSGEIALVIAAEVTANKFIDIYDVRHKRKTVCRTITKTVEWNSERDKGCAIVTNSFVDVGFLACFTKQGQFVGIFLLERGQ